jgi:integrase
MQKSTSSQRTRNRVKITQAFIKGIKATGKRQKIYDATVPGLLLRVSADANSQVWAFDYYTKEQRRGLFTIGSVKDWPLSEVKAKARQLAGLVAMGGDPHAEKVAEREQRKAKQLAKQIAKGRTLRAYLYGDYYERYLAKRPRGKGEAQRIKSTVSMQQRIAAAWAPLLDLDMAALQVREVEAHRRKRAKAGVKATTLNRDRTALLSMLNDAVETGVIDANPIAKFKAIDLAPNEGKRTRFLGQHDHDPDERDRFIAALKKQPLHFQTIVNLALLSGMRRKEVLLLQWRDVSLRRSSLTVRAENAKSGVERPIALPPAAVKLLTAWKAQSNITSIDGLVFPNPKTGKPYTTLQKRWQTLVDDADIEDFTFRDCRHDYASRLVSAGVDLYVVRDLLGHSSIEMTQIYAHLAASAKHDAVAVLN